MTRVGSLARAEATLLRRDPLALLSAVGVPLVFVPLVASSGMYDADKAGWMIVTLVGVSILAGTYYNLVTAIVARREGHVLKRLRTGELRDEEILLGTAAPSVVLTWTQSLVGCGLVLALVGPTDTANVLLAATAVLLGTAVFVLLAVVTAAFTRTVELAQVTTLPGLLVPLALSGLMIPVEHLPGWAQTVAPFGPLSPVVDLLTVALTGSGGPVVGPTAVLLGWLVVGGWAARRWMRWDVRR